MGVDPCTLVVVGDSFLKDSVGPFSWVRPSLEDLEREWRCLPRGLTKPSDPFGTYD